jgi:hypothetical protein
MLLNFHVIIFYNISGTIKSIYSLFMFLEMWSILGLLALLLSFPFSHAAPASSPECNSPIYQALLLPLARYAPVESFCSKNYQVRASTVTATATVKERRGDEATTTSSADPRAAIWTSLFSEAGSF